MNILLQIGIVFLLVTASDVLARNIAFPVPVSIIGIVILLILLLTKIIKIKHIEEISNFFLKNMGFFFIAAGVSILGKYQLIENILIQFALIVFVTTLITFAITGLSVKYAIVLQNKMRKNDKNDRNI
ncbi:CidA/LrgA family protein [Anaerosinus massiliensis]|uniref:CidA/LrgA family protein n=1 Tax=Massilibacillus massiliensis TaxID=1806837 RepID=UPI000DA5ED19|nr:CidA/LrgA family protein [Massilibacillus massiliensis]